MVKTGTANQVAISLCNVTCGGSRLMLCEKEGARMEMRNKTWERMNSNKYINTQQVVWTPCWFF